MTTEVTCARVRVLSPEQIEERLADRFRLLTGGARSGAARQQTLCAAIDYSYELLDEQERLLFERLAKARQLPRRPRHQVAWACTQRTVHQALADARADGAIPSPFITRLSRACVFCQES